VEGTRETHAMFRNTQTIHPTIMPTGRVHIIERKRETSPSALSRKSPRSDIVIPVVLNGVRTLSGCIVCPTPFGFMGGS